MERRVDRIMEMERYLDEAVAVIAMMNEALDRYVDALPNIAKLEEYYQDTLWHEDFDADSAGQLPNDLKRGVLSEDAVYNKLCDNQQLLDILRKIANTGCN